MITVFYALFRGLPNAKVRRELDPPAWTHPLQRWGKTLIWTAGLERRFRTTAILVLGAHQCGVTHRAQKTPWGPSAADMVERTLASAELAVLNAWRRWPRRAERSKGHRKDALRNHAGLVAAAIRKEALRLDGPDRDEALERLADLLLTIANRYSKGQLGALLPSGDLQELTPVRHREGRQTVLMVGGVVAVTGRGGHRCRNCSRGPGHVGHW
ncbi:hypothetical protein [Streptomyces sp. AB3(2024)]|uniref:hypothetical protein n=1 Tax=Streptomyces sp. AB3(2024) TaxID=3317321 RepID=UPI0035A39AA6